MVIVELYGGLGNQLFQYATGRSLACKNNTNLKLNIKWFELIKNQFDTTFRLYGLNAFNIIEDFASTDEVEKLKKTKPYWAFEMLLPYRFRTFIRETNFDFNPKIFKRKSNAYLRGYWQSEKYFKEIADVLKKEFTLKVPLAGKYLTAISDPSSVSIHIRRGDKLNLPKHTYCRLDYFMKAIDIIVNKLKDPHFYVFSEDIEWAKQNLKIKQPVIFVSDGEIKDYEEMILMSKCQHNIISNSTFSWWSAWLNDNPDKIVIAPRIWVNNNKRSINDLIPEGWIKI